MPRMLDLSDEVRAEIGDEEADRLLAGQNAPGAYDCTSCRTPGDSDRERTSADSIDPDSAHGRNVQRRQ